VTFLAVLEEAEVLPLFLPFWEATLPEVDFAALGGMGGYGGGEVGGRVG